MCKGREPNCLRFAGMPGLFVLDDPTVLLGVLYGTTVVGWVWFIGRRVQQVLVRTRAAEQRRRRLDAEFGLSRSLPQRWRWRRSELNDGQ